MKRVITLLSILLFISYSAPLLAADDCIPKAPKPLRFVNDLARIINDNSEVVLERALQTFNDTTSTQIVIVTVDDLCGYDPASFTFDIGENWGVGNSDFDNGIVIMIKPKQPNSRGQAFIATGYGLEGVLPDATAKRIVEKEMIPFFKKNDYERGIFTAAQVVMEITGGEYSAKNYNGKKAKGKNVPLFPVLFILFFVGLMSLSTLQRARSYSRKNNMGFWAALWLMGSMNSRHRGRYNDFTSGGGGFGGFGGGSGGFGGFGGGSFGGGGAGGSW